MISKLLCTFLSLALSYSVAHANFETQATNTGENFADETMDASDVAEIESMDPEAVRFLWRCTASSRRRAGVYQGREAMTRQMARQTALRRCERMTGDRCMIRSCHRHWVRY